MFESPLEESLGYQLHARMRGHCEVTEQFKCPTRFGCFRLDFMVARGRKRVGIEVDGRGFHDHDRDKMRDAMILDAGHATDVVRFSGASVHYHIKHCLYLLCHVFPELFPEREHEVLDDLSREFSGYEVSTFPGLAMIGAKIDDGPREYLILMSHRGAGFDGGWRDLAAFARSCGERTIAGVMAKYEAR